MFGGKTYQVCCTRLSKHLFDSLTTQERVKKLLLEHQEPLNQGTGPSLAMKLINYRCAPVKMYDSQPIHGLVI
jgi:hypothetical protein